MIIVRKELHVSWTEDENGTKFFYKNLGNETHGRPSFRLWISSKLVTKKDNKHIVELPAKAKIVKTEKGSLILKPDPNYLTYNIFVPCGYRGDSVFYVLSPDNYEKYAYYEYSSPRGSCGISQGGLVVVTPPSPIKVRWERTGRTYGSPKEGVAIIMPNGEVRRFDMLPDGLSELQKIKEELEE